MAETLSFGGNRYFVDCDGLQVLLVQDAAEADGVLGRIQHQFAVLKFQRGKAVSWAKYAE